MPVEDMNFRPFHSIGLWLAVSDIPPDAPSCSTANCTVGVGTTPSATTSQPMERRVDDTILPATFPVILPSRPSTIVPRLQYSANAAEYFTRTSGVRLSPTMPRMPDMLTIKLIYELRSS